TRCGVSCPPCGTRPRLRLLGRWSTATNGSVDMLLKSTLIAAGLVVSAASASAQTVVVAPGPYYGPGPGFYGPPVYAAPAPVMAAPPAYCGGWGPRYGAWGPRPWGGPGPGPVYDVGVVGPGWW